MRDYKFRAWHKKAKEMYLDVPYFIKWETLPTKGNRYYGRYRYLGFPENCWQTPWVDDVIFMQYIGLHDKNGKEIYEGDIYQYDNCNFGYGDPKQPEQLRATLNNIENLYGDEFVLCALKNCEVIGNIHEHPHLLKED